MLLSLATSFFHLDKNNSEVRTLAMGEQSWTAQHSLYPSRSTYLVKYCFPNRGMESPNMKADESTVVLRRAIMKAFDPT